MALIIALILVALATILATKLTFDGFLERRRTIGVLAAEQARISAWVPRRWRPMRSRQDVQNSPQQTTLAAALGAAHPALAHHAAGRSRR